MNSVRLSAVMAILDALVSALVAAFRSRVSLVVENLVLRLDDDFGVDHGPRRNEGCRGPAAPRGF